MLYSIRHSTRKDRHLPILLVYLGYQHELETTCYPKGSNFFLLNYCIQGKGEFVLAEQRCVIQAGQILLAWPHVPLSSKSLSDDCAIHLIGFTGPICDELLRLCGMGESGIYQVSEKSVFLQYMQKFLSSHKQGSAQDKYSKLCYGLLVDLSSHIMKLSDTTTTAPVNEAIQIVIDYLETNYQRQISLEAIADEVHLTKEYLCTLFKKEMGHTILHHLTLIRVGWARLYLEQYPEKKVYEIGKMCGFESPSYFGKKFLEIVGTTPENYRRVNSIVL